MRKVLTLFALILLSFGMLGYLFEKTDGFSASAIQFNIPHHPEWEIAPLTEEKQEQLAEILDQKFFYLGKGARSYAFFSEDGDYVIKFFKYRYHTPHWAVTYLPSIPPFNYYRNKKIGKVSLETVLNGYKVAFDNDPAGTGLLYIHLNPSSHKHQTFTLLDKNGTSHTIELDDTRFVIQYKARELSEILHTHLMNGEVDSAKQRLFETFDHYLTQFEKGLYDLGVGLAKNNGFIGNKPIHFDVGKLTLDDRIRDPKFHRQVSIKLAKNIDRRLRKKYPQFHEPIMRGLEAKLSNIYGEEIVLHEKG